MMKFIDLQTHTTFSDGKLTPEELIDLAISKNLAAIAITDHDNLDALPIAMKYAKDIEIIPGVEMSCDDYENNLPNIHLLGLFIDYNDKNLKNLVTKIKSDGQKAPRI
jgi:3',5'-nucleoside bisphosphate phosphatase